MKKLMIAAVAVAMAACAQAASVSWNTGKLYKAVDANGTFGTTRGEGLASASGATLSWYVFTGLSADDYKLAQTSGNVYGWLTEGPDSGTKLSANPQGTSAQTTGTAISTTASANDVINWASVIVYTDADNKVWYVENFGTDTIDAIGSDVIKNNLGSAKAIGGATITSWTAAQAAPEPTSGLLLLLGVAGLALRRRRA